ncbi:MAG: hypothetical protein HY550_08065 [Elusimicrobia bacterium]|nr:hypothetical protein [Elusimicrobiota bacterium]
MKNKSIFGLVVASVCFSFPAGAARAAALNSGETFADSLSPSALARVELPAAALPAQPPVLPYNGDPFLYFLECRIVDAKFFVQPTIPESVQLLSGCMKRISKQYKVAAAARVLVTPWGGPGGGAQGSSLSGISITVSGKISAGNPVLRDLSASLRRRNNRLFGHYVLLSPSRTGSADLSDKGTNSIPASLRAAVKEAQRKELDDMGYFFGFDSYPAKTKLTKILADVIGYDEADINSDVFAMSSGDAAVRAFTRFLRAEAASEAEDTLPQSQIIAGSIRNVAAEAEKAFIGTQQFANVRLASHNRTEDGDMDYWLLIAQEKDGSFQVLNYTRNPY